MAQKLCYEANKMKLQSNFFRSIRYFNILHPNFWEIAFPHRPPISAPCLISNQTVYFIRQSKVFNDYLLKIKIIIHPVRFEVSTDKGNFTSSRSTKVVTS